MSINETRREAIINKLKELEEFLEPEGAHFVLHLFTSKDVTEESYSECIQQLQFENSGHVSSEN